MTVEITVRSVEATTVVELHGEINSVTSGALHTNLLPLVKEPTELLIDLSGVSYISSAGLRTLLLIHREAEQVGTRLILDGLLPEVRFVMSATGFLGFFRLRNDVEAGREGGQP